MPLYIGLVGLALFGCGQEFSSKKYIKDQRKSSQPDGPSRENTIGYASISLKALQAHHYQAAISWPETLPGVSVLVNKTSVFSAEDPLVHSYDLDLEDSKEYVIYVVSVSPETKEQKLITSWTVQTPRDFVLSNDELDGVFKDQTKIALTVHRLFVPKADPEHYSLLTNGRDLVIDTDVLIANDSIISTFNKDQKTSANRDGSNGGSIVIKALRAIGNLSFELRGENGGDGLNGEAQPLSAKAGANGISADYAFRCTGENHRICTCDPKTANREIGKLGADGAPGRDGTNGGRGGNSGSIKIEISEKSPRVHINILSQNGGVSGSPGKSGVPQLGGPGGKAYHPVTSPWVTYVCGNPADGKDGATGPYGKDGNKQIDGTREANCISIGEGFGRCS